MICISNKGNSTGKFKWETESKIFTVYPREGEVLANGSCIVKITYKPSVS